MSKILIFDHELSGHHLEYLHHIYTLACEEKEHDFCFCVPEEIKKIFTLFEWPEQPNIVFTYLNESEISYLSCSNNNILSSYRLSKICSRYIRRGEFDYVFFNVIIKYLPFSPLFFPRKVKVIGIVYKIYLYIWKESSLLSKLSNIVKYFLFSKCHIFHKILILNDEAASRQLNKIWKTNRFISIPDPYLPIDECNLPNIREDFKIAGRKKIILHLGALSYGKGTMDIFMLIEDVIKRNLCDDFCFIFAGHIFDDIREEFYHKVSCYKNLVEIFVFDEFCSYPFFGGLCKCSNLLVLPYKETSQSSGLIGYAAQFKIPVLMPRKGLTGRLVKNNKLGYAYRDREFLPLFQEITKGRQIEITSSYLSTHTVKSFLNVIRPLFINNRK